jgi:hypothetical protein
MAGDTIKETHMKKLLYLLLLLPSLAWGQEYARMNPYILGGGVSAAAASPYCTGTTTCTGTNPGSCDMFCEDYEGSSDCGGTGDDTYCQNTFTSVTIGSGDTLVFNGTASGVYPCSGTTNSRVMQIDVSAASRQTYAKMTLSDVSDFYVQFYFIIVAESLGDNGTMGVLEITNSDSSNVAMLYVKQVTGSLKMKLEYYNSASGTTYSADGATSLSAGTWYRIRLRALTSAGTITFWIDDTEQITESTTFTTTRTIGALRIGQTAYGSTGSAAFTTQYDNITLDDDTMAGACLN